MGPQVDTPPTPSSPLKRDAVEDMSILESSPSSKKPKTNEEEDDPNRVGATELASAFALASLANMKNRPTTTVVAPATTKAPSTDDASIEEHRSPHPDPPVPISPETRSPMPGNKRVSFAANMKEPTRTGPRRSSFPPRTNSRMPPGFAARRIGQHPWVCDYCNAASFATYPEACAHEQMCRRRMLARSGTSRGFAGTMTLATDNDPEYLTGLQCYLRQHCVEAFCDEHDENLQVGLRCQFCRHVPQKEIAAVTYPANLMEISDAFKTWQRVHLVVCKHVPDQARKMLAQMHAQEPERPTPRAYWVDSARFLGLIDTPKGLRFGRDPAVEKPRMMAFMNVPSTRRFPHHHPMSHHHRRPFMPPPYMQPMPQQQHIRLPLMQPQQQPQQPPPMQQQPRRNAMPRPPPAPTTPDTGPPVARLGLHQPIVTPSDATHIPPYVYFLMSNVESCQFTEVDRFVARSKGPLGTAGFQCRHCHGHAGLGKYFPVSPKALATNSTSQNLHAHLLKCRECPANVQHELVVLKEEKRKAPRLEPGWRKLFFDRLWKRMHGSGNAVVTTETSVVSGLSTAAV